MSNGPDSGLANAITIAMILIVVIPILIIGAIGYRVARNRQLSKQALLGITIGCGILGGLLGLLTIALTFFLNYQTVTHDELDSVNLAA